MRPTAYRQPVTRRDLERLLGRTIDADAVSRPRTAGLADAVVLDVTPTRAPASPDAVDRAPLPLARRPGGPAANPL